MSSTLHKLVENIERVIRGKRESVETLVTALVAGGHALLEDVPGLGKTVLARALARSLDLKFSRIQATPDLLPSDVTGSSIFDPRDQAFHFRRGPVFANILLVDEINRATPRTQSALLEAMEEHTVSADGVTHALEEPFFMVATQNPIELTGTFPLPEAQLDRFLVKLSLGYPDDDTEVEILTEQRERHPLDGLESCLSREELLEAQRRARRVPIHESVVRYIQRIAAATRRLPGVACGVSPRGALGLLHASQAHALLAGEDFVTPDQVQKLAGPVLGHRVVLEAAARLKGEVTGLSVIDRVLLDIPVPVDFSPPSSTE